MKKTTKRKIDRGAVMREAWRLVREEGMDKGDAMRAAWANAKTPRQLKQQASGVRAALKRYGVDADRLAERAKESVRAIVAAIDTTRPALLPPPPGSTEAIDLRRGTDGVYRI